MKMTAQADLEKANWYLDNCVIKAPVDGTILKKGAEKGNIVNPIAFNISSSLCDMADLSDLEVDLKIQERDIPKVHNGQDCVAMPEAYQNDPDFLKIHPKGYTRRGVAADADRRPRPGRHSGARQARHPQGRGRRLPQARYGDHRRVPQEVTMND